MKSKSSSSKVTSNFLSATVDDVFQAFNLSPSITGGSESINPQVLAKLKLLSKKEPLTRSRALQELLREHIQSEIKPNVVIFWNHFHSYFIRGAILDSDWKCRSLYFAACLSVFNIIGRKMEPQLGSIVPLLLMGKFDRSNREVPIAASKCFETMFPDDTKRSKIIRHFRPEILRYVEGILDSSPSSLSKDFRSSTETTSDETTESIERWNRVIASGLGVCEYILKDSDEALTVISDMKPYKFFLDPSVANTVVLNESMHLLSVMYSSSYAPFGAEVSGRISKSLKARLFEGMQEGWTLMTLLSRTVPVLDIQFVEFIERFDIRQVSEDLFPQLGEVIQSKFTTRDILNQLSVSIKKRLVVFQTDPRVLRKHISMIDSMLGVYMNLLIELNKLEELFDLFKFDFLLQKSILKRLILKKELFDFLKKSENRIIPFPHIFIVLRSFDIVDDDPAVYGSLPVEYIPLVFECVGRLESNLVDSINLVSVCNTLQASAATGILDAVLTFKFRSDKDGFDDYWKSFIVDKLPFSILVDLVEKYIESDWISGASPVRLFLKPKDFTDSLFLQDAFIRAINLQSSILFPMDSTEFGELIRDLIDEKNEFSRKIVLNNCKNEKIISAGWSAGYYCELVDLVTGLNSVQYRRSFLEKFDLTRDTQILVKIFGDHPNELIDFIIRNDRFDLTIQESLQQLAAKSEDIYKFEIFSKIANLNGPWSTQDLSLIEFLKTYIDVSHMMRDPFMLIPVFEDFLRDARLDGNEEAAKFVMDDSLCYFNLCVIRRLLDRMTVIPDIISSSLHSGLRNLNGIAERNILNLMLGIPESTEILFPPHPSSLFELMENEITLSLLLETADPETARDFLPRLTCLNVASVASLFLGHADLLEDAFERYLKSGRKANEIDERIVSFQISNGSIGWVKICLESHEMDLALDRITRSDLSTIFVNFSDRIRLGNELMYDELVSLNLWKIVLSKYLSVEDFGFFIDDESLPDSVKDIFENQLGDSCFVILADIDRNHNESGWYPLYLVAVEVLGLYLQSMAPGRAHDWISGKRRVNSAFAEKICLDHGISSSVLEAEMTGKKRYANNNLRMNYSSSSRLLVCNYSSHEGEIQANLRVNFPNCWPLRLGETEVSPVVGLSKAKNARLQLSIQSVFKMNGIQNAIQIWIENIEGFLEGVEECYICYSVTYHHGTKGTGTGTGTGGSIPNKQCKTCKYRFHSECLLKYFRTSGKTICCLCQNPF